MGKRRRGVGDGLFLPTHHHYHHPSPPKKIPRRRGVRGLGCFRGLVCCFRRAGVLFTYAHDAHLTLRE